MEFSPFPTIRLLDVSECGLDLSMEALADRPCLGSEFEHLRSLPEGTSVGCYLETDRVGWVLNSEVIRGVGDQGEPRFLRTPFVHTTGDIDPDRDVYYTYMFLEGASETFCATLRPDSACHNTNGCRYAIGPALIDGTTMSGREWYGRCVYSSADGTGVVHP